MILLFGGILPKGTVWDSSRLQWKDFFLVPMIGFLALGLMKSEHDRNVLRIAYGTLFAIGALALLILLAIVGTTVGFEPVVQCTSDVVQVFVRMFKQQMQNLLTENLHTEL